MTDERLSDENTGLPPLGELGSDPVLLVMLWESGSGIAVSPYTREAVPCRFLHARGLAVGPSGDPTDVEWVQVHLAVPVEHAVDVAAALARGGEWDV